MEEPPVEPVDPAAEEVSESEGASLRQRAAALRGRAKDLESKAQERLAVEQAQRGWVRGLVDTWDADRNRGGGLLAGGLAYRLFLWQLPAMLLVISVLNVIAQLAGQEPITTVQQSGMAAEVASAIAEAVGSTDQSWWWLTIVGFVLMVWAGRGAVKALWLVEQIAWQQREQRPNSVKASLTFSGFMLTALLLPLVLAGAIQGPFVVDVLVWITGTLLMAALATFGVSQLPRGGRPWTAILPGVAGFVVLQRVITLSSAIYFGARLESVDDLYGAMGVAIAIQLWLYVMTRLFVAAQFLNATFAGVPVGRLGDDLIGVAAPRSESAESPG